MSNRAECSRHFDHRSSSLNDVAVYGSAPSAERQHLTTLHAGGRQCPGVTAALLPHLFYMVLLRGRRRASFNFSSFGAVSGHETTRTNPAYE